MSLPCDYLALTFFQRSEQAIPETAAKYQGLIFQISRNILENPQDAEECVNDTYLGLWNAIPPRTRQASWPMSRAQKVYHRKRRVL